eukprot:6030017-Amphidinium_carterae.1
MDASNRIRWRAQFNNCAEGVNQWRFLRSKTRGVPPCYEPLLPRAECFIQEFCRVAWSACSVKRVPPLVPYAVRDAMRRIKYGSWGVLPTDKDGGFALVNKMMLRSAFENALNASTYERVAITPLHAEDVVRDYIQVCGESCGSDKYLFNALTSSCREGCEYAVYFKLGGTVKTHKNAGKVVLRPLHAMSPLSPLAPGMRLISSMLMPKLKSIPYLLRDSADLLDKVNGMKFNRTATFVKLDVKDFYLSGAHSTLLEMSAKGVAEHHRSAYASLLSCILRSQFVKVPFPGHGHERWQ